MRIWFDASSDRHQENVLQGSDDCGDCSDCNAPIDYSVITSPFINVDGTGMQMDRALHWSPLLYTQECGEGRWLLCNPIEGGQMVVLDAPAMALFELFQQPMTVEQAYLLRVDQSVRMVKAVIRFLYQCGFLRLGDEATL